jgi:hypothetical protein
LLAGGGDGLTRESADHNVDSSQVSFSDVEHIVEPFSVRPVPRENVAAKRVDLDLPNATHTRPRETEIETADSREQ